MPTIDPAARRSTAAMAMFLTGLGFAPVGVLPLPAHTAFAWFLLQTPPPAAPIPVRAFLTTDDAEAR
jgi:hypothetical protein